ncbi:MAG: 5'-methylthioadenosine/S-adenosylhomocysteine nucleosidase [Oscillospiraceae bacterium]|jgi:adenosylhomocysteine nucleosidase|nr:5'-methylthioadenosine/S-adenosylhomocysteine nucleosidase [Oscillospiraceae bacterium]
MMKIAILVAMGMEASRLIARIEGARPERAAGREFLRGRIGQAEVVLHICGMGMRKAAAGTRALIENYRPDILVNYGVSGGLAPGIGVGDTVVAVSSRPASGRAYRTEAAVPTDGDLADFAARVLPQARKGPAATSLGIIVSKKRKARLVEKSGALCVDMETYAAAKTARALGAPLLLIRCMSDTFEPASLLRFFKNGAMAAERAAADTERVIKALAEGRT